MTNLDKIRAMSAEELVLRYHSVRPCKVCSYFEDDECSLKGYAGERECNGGRIKWLNQEDNPMPEIKVGDVLETGSDGCRYYYIGNDEAVRTTHIHQSKNLPIVRRCVLDIKGDIVKIWRENDNSMLLGAKSIDVIWRADNDL